MGAGAPARDRRRAVRGPAGIAPVGPAMTALRAVAARTVSFIRCAVIAYIAVQVLIWHSFYSAEAWRLARLAAAAFVLVVILAIFAALRPAMRTEGRVAARRAALASRSAAE